MRLIDRYLMREFLMTFAYCLLAFVLMRVVFDLFDSLKDFLDFQSSLLLVVKYYLLMLPAAVAMALPAALFFGLLFMLVTMSKNNELTALRAAGQNLLRLCCSIMGVALAATGAVFALDELLVPASSAAAQNVFEEQRTIRKIVKGKRESMAWLYLKTNLTYVNHREGRRWRFGQFNEKTLSGEDVIVACTASHPERTINARFAYWVKDHWLFQNVKLITYGEHTAIGGPVPTYHESLEDPTITDSPEDIVLFDKKEPQFMTLPQLQRYLQLHPKEELAAFRVSLQQRFALPWSCVVACLMAIPLGAGTGRRSAVVGVASALVLFACYLFAYHFGVKLGETSRLDPIVATWAANGVFTLLGLMMIWRVR